MKSKNFDLTAIRTLKNYSPSRVYVHMLIEKIFQCKNLCELEPFEGHFGAVASNLSILYVGERNKMKLRQEVTKIILRHCKYFCVLASLDRTHTNHVDFEPIYI